MTNDEQEQLIRRIQELERLNDELIEWLRETTKSASEGWGMAYNLEMQVKQLINQKPDHK